MIPAGSFWNVEAVSSRGTSPSAPEARTRNVSFTLNAHPILSPPAAINLGSLTPGIQVLDVTPVPGRAIWYRFELPKSVNPSSYWYLDIDAVNSERGGGNFGLYNRAGRLINSGSHRGGAGYGLVTYGSGPGTRPSVGSNAWPLNGANGSLDVDTYYLAVVSSGSFDSNFGANQDPFRASGVSVRIQYGLGQLRPAPSALDLGTLQAGTTLPTPLSAPFGGLRWYKFTIPHPVENGNGRFLDIDTETSTRSSGRLSLYNSAGDLVGDNDRAGSEGRGQLTFGPTAPSRARFGDGMSYDGRNGNLEAGVYYLCVQELDGRANPTNWSVFTVASFFGEIPVRIHYGIASPRPNPNPQSELGSLVKGQTNSQLLWVPATTVQWIRFNLPLDIRATNANTLDIDTHGTYAFGTEGLSTRNFTSIALYSDSGEVLAKNGGGGGSGRSLLTFGTGAGDRGKQGTNGHYIGYHGELRAGNYWLAVGTHDADMARDFDVFAPPATNHRSGFVRVNLRLNAPVTGPMLVGSVNLRGWDISPSVKTLSFRVYSGYSLVADTEVFPESDGTYQARFVGVPNGTYDVFVRTQSFLWKRYSDVTFQEGTTTELPISLINGDIRADNEIGSQDFSTFAQQFGRTFMDDRDFLVEADLNGDDEIGTADFSILASNYDLQGDDPPQP